MRTLRAVGLSALVGTSILSCGQHAESPSAHPEAAAPPSVTDILAQVQASLRDGSASRASAPCHYDHSVGATPSREIVERLLRMSTKHIYKFEYFDVDGIAEAILKDENPRIELSLWVVTKNHQCERFTLSEIVE